MSNSFMVEQEKVDTALIKLVSQNLLEPDELKCELHHRCLCLCDAPKYGALLKVGGDSEIAQMKLTGLRVTQIRGL